MYTRWHIHCDILLLMQIPIRFLFIPVSSIKGIGEYMRSLILAKEIKLRWPGAKIKFILNRHVRYVDSCPFETELLDSSPTKHIAEVNKIIEDFRPQLVVFDASGRQAQLAKAKSIGAITIFISQHAKKRCRGMRWKRAKFTDFHFVAQPEFAIKPVGYLDKLKLKLLKKAEPDCVGAFFNQPSIQKSNDVLKRFGVEKGQYLIASAGSGGHQSNGEFVAEIFYRATEEITKKIGLKTIMVMGPGYPNALPKSNNVIIISSLDNDSFIALLDNAKAALLSGGHSLLQALALQTPVLACPVSKDQPDRIKICQKRKIVNSVDLELLVEKASLMLTEEKLQALKSQLQQQPSSNGVNTILKYLTERLSILK